MTRAEQVCPFEIRFYGDWVRVLLAETLLICIRHRRRVGVCDGGYFGDIEETPAALP